MTKSLARTGARALAPRRGRSYELAETPESALARLRGPTSPPVLSLEEAKRAADREPFIVLRERAFTLYKPWRARLQSAEAMLTRDVRVGPAVTGRLVATARGARLDVDVRRFAVTPAQRRELAVAALGLAVFIVAPIALAGANPIALGLAAAMLLGVLGSVLLYGRAQRERDIRELLAIVERTFGPLELPAGDGSPRRRDHPRGDDPHA